MTAVADRIATITWTETGGVDPLHDVVDHAKHAALVLDMAARGWQGPPIVVAGVQGYTGSHRIAATVTLWNEHRVQVDIPRVDIRELCAEFGIDWDAVLDENSEDTYAAAADLRFLLPRDVVDYLGYDVDG